ncbi:hypothetical protein HanXRQr2_Chr09g0379951 [Helianthus annuus]|uniref:Uncharacterized protein n=1 Tax=Helianthus annuus TaxID=4232 RepID=A0A9K3I4K3_HELAN|nr:hypothetical protein HanXRQr2_Chr09g0379951 [Helianthus annuus]
MFQDIKENTLWWMLRKYLWCRYNKLGIACILCLRWYSNIL